MIDIGRSRDLTGTKNVRLTVLYPDHWHYTPSGQKVLMWHVKCDCGKEKIVAAGDLKPNRVTSCGCLLKEKVTTHGMTGTPEYISWYNMIQRCTNKNNTSFSYYGERNITVCDRWLRSFENFYKDMGPRSAGHSIERRNNSKGYSPDNCYWANAETQANNKRSNHYLTLGNITDTMSNWSKIAGPSYTTIRARIRLGWTTPQALLTPAGGDRFAPENNMEI